MKKRINELKNEKKGKKLCAKGYSWYTFTKK